MSSGKAAHETSTIAEAQNALDRTHLVLALITHINSHFFLSARWTKAVIHKFWQNKFFFLGLLGFHVANADALFYQQAGETVHWTLVNIREDNCWLDRWLSWYQITLLGVSPSLHLERLLRPRREEFEMYNLCVLRASA